MNWQIKLFSELTNNELYDILKLRVDVFIVEQTCYYADLDGLDTQAQVRHLLAYSQNKVTAYLRALPPGLAYPDCASIGRVITSPEYRGTGLGNELLRRGLALCQQYWPNAPVKISAQDRLKEYYAKHGFVAVSKPYLQDGMPHIAMLREADK